MTNEKARMAIVALGSEGAVDGEMEVMPIE